MQTKNDIQNNENNTIKLPKASNPLEISKLTKEDANTTPLLPKKTYEKGDGESSFYSNITEKSEFLNEDLREMMKNEENIQYYKEITNKDTLEKAYEKLQEGGIEGSINKIFGSKSQRSLLKEHLLVFSDLVDINGDIVVASIKLNGTGQIEIDSVNKNELSNVVTSIYGRENYDYQLKQRKDGTYTGWMEDNANNDRIIYDIDEGIKKNNELKASGYLPQTPIVRLLIIV